MTANQKRSYFFGGCALGLAICLIALVMASCAAQSNGEPAKPSQVTAAYADGGNHVVCYQLLGVYGVALSCLRLQPGDRDY